MPDFLGDDLTALRDRVATLAQGPLAALRDDATLSPADLAAHVRALSKQAGLFTLTQADDTPALTLLVARETLARHGVGHLPGLFGADAGVLAGVAERFDVVFLHENEKDIYGDTPQRCLDIVESVGSTHLRLALD